MENLANIYYTNENLFNKLVEYNCILSKYGKTIFEGKILDAQFNDEENGTMIVCKFDLPDNKQFICTLNENIYVKELSSIVESNNDLDILLKDAKTYNRLYTLANNLPVFNIIAENELSNKTYQYKVLIENMLLLNK